MEGSLLLFSRRIRALILVGPFTTPYQPEVCPGDVVFGVRLWPCAGTALLAVDPRALRDWGGLATEVLPGSWPRRLEEGLLQTDTVDDGLALLNQFLEDRSAEASPPDMAVMGGVAELIRSGGRTSIRDLAEAEGLSPRQFRRRFGAAVGLSPKEFARVRRFRASAIRAVLGEETSWADVAAEYGFADQAHLSHEYRRVIGLAPKSFEEQFAQIHHRLLEPSESDED